MAQAVADVNNGDCTILGPGCEERISWPGKSTRIVSKHISIWFTVAIGKLFVVAVLDALSDVRHFFPRRLRWPAALELFAVGVGRLNAVHPFRLCPLRRGRQ
jgi:hypothetical protein